MPDGRHGDRRLFDYSPWKARGPGRVGPHLAGRIEKLLRDPGIVRNRLSVEAVVTDARAVPAVQEEAGSFDRCIGSCYVFMQAVSLVNDHTTDCFRYA